MQDAQLLMLGGGLSELKLGGGLSELKLGSGLSELMQGRKYCSEEELTKDLLIKFLMLKGELTAVETFDVQVQALSGDSFVVKMDRQDARVSVLKTEIEKAVGASTYQQDLFDFAEEEDDRGVLTDTTSLIGPCTVILSVRAVPDHLHWRKWSGGGHIGIISEDNMSCQYFAAIDDGRPGRRAVAIGSVQIDEGEAGYWEVAVSGENLAGVIQRARCGSPQPPP